MAVKDKGTALEGFFALYDGTGNSQTTIRETVTTKCLLEYEQVELVHNHGGKPLRGTPLGKLPEMWPFDLLKRPLLEHTRKFIQQIATHGYHPLTGEYEFKAWGPFMEKIGDDLSEWTPEEGNHLIPKAHQRKAVKAWLYRGDEFQWSKGCAYLIRGEFTRYAGHGAVDEETGVIIV
jgi:hypothetical protein